MALIFCKKNGPKLPFLRAIGAQTFYYSLYAVTTTCCVPWQSSKNRAGKSATQDWKNWKKELKGLWNMLTRVDLKPRVPCYIVVLHLTDFLLPYATRIWIFEKHSNVNMNSQFGTSLAIKGSMMTIANPSAIWKI